MTREEEIHKAAKIFHASSDDYTVYKKGFETGAEWADQHPREGLWDAEKVIDYIYHHAHVRTFGDIVMDDMSVTEFIETMKRAMEG